jgi:hypothetical protein
MLSNDTLMLLMINLVTLGCFGRNKKIKSDGGMEERLLRKKNGKFYPKEDFSLGSAVLCFRFDP